MHRNLIIRQLRAYQTLWKEESDTVNRFIDFVTTNTDCFKRTLIIGHVTGSAWVVNKKGTYFNV